MNKNKRVLLLVFIIFLLFILLPSELYGDYWLKVEEINEEKMWIDKSHWETKKAWIDDGYYRDIQKKRWIDTSQTIEEGHWVEDVDKIWVKSYAMVPYVDYEWIDTSYLVKKQRTVTKWIKASLIIYSGTNSYGWSVYSFAAKQKKDCTIKYKGDTYRAKKWEIDYRPIYGGRIKAIKYSCYQKQVEVKEYYYELKKEGYWKPVISYKKVDTSHWETKVKKIWIDDSYVVSSGYWEFYNEKEWVKEGHYEDKLIWVEDGYYCTPMHGVIEIEKTPRYIFTKWHKDDSDCECSMKLRIGWELDNSNLMQGEESKKVSRIYIYQDLNRYDSRGTKKIVIFDQNISPSENGLLDVETTFDYSGDEESKLHIFFISEEGENIHVYFNNPVNGFRSLNLDKTGCSEDANKWLGGNNYGKIEF